METMKQGTSGEFRQISKWNINIDHSYQRPPKTDNQIKRISKNWDWNAFGVIIVAERTDKSLWVLDGQHRLLAARANASIETVPCIVFRVDNHEEEAKSFITNNTIRNPVRVVHRFRAAVSAGMQPEADINQYLTQNGMEVNKSNTTRGGIDFPDRLIKTWLRNQDACKRAIMVQREICGSDDSMVGFIHVGIFACIMSGINIEKHIGKIVQAGGKRSIVKTYRALHLEAGTLSNESLARIAIMRIINKGKRNKIGIGHSDD